MTPWLTSTIFVVTYGLIASRKLALLPIGRPAGAMAGAVLMIAVGALTPEQAYASIDANTLVLLFALMALSNYLDRAGAFARLTDLALRARMSGRQLLVTLVMVSGVLSAFLLNDTVCIFLTPVVCDVCVRRKLPLGPYLLALSTSANIGSAATLVGNPQNILIGSMGPFDFPGFALICAPAALLGLAINAGLLLAYFDAQLPQGALFVPTNAPPPREPMSPAPLVVTALMAVGYLVGLHLALCALCGVTALVLFDRKEPRELFAQVDWALIVFFAALFVVMRAFALTGIPQAAWALVASELDLSTPSGVAWLSGTTLLGSNLFSNVPLVMLVGPWLRAVPDPERGFALLGFVSTVAGNLTLLGSVANIIVAERARDHYELGFMEYLRFGAVSTLVVLAAGVLAVCALT